MSLTAAELEAFYSFARQRVDESKSIDDLEEVLDAFRRQCGSCIHEPLTAGQRPTELPATETSSWGDRLRRWAEGFPGDTPIADDRRSAVYSDDR